VTKYRQSSNLPRVCAYFTTTGGGIRELTDALPESIYTSSPSKGVFTLPPHVKRLSDDSLSDPHVIYSPLAPRLVPIPISGTLSATLPLICR